MDQIDNDPILVFLEQKKKHHYAMHSFSHLLKVPKYSSNRNIIQLELKIVSLKKCCKYDKSSLTVNFS